MQKYKFERSVFVTVKRLKNETEASNEEITRFKKLRNQVYWALPLLMLLALTITPLLLWLLS